MKIQRLDNYPVIYKITNLISGKIYVGQTQNLYQRYCRHKTMRGKGKIQKAFKSYGFENFQFDILEKIEDLSLINKREEYWMDKLNSLDDEIGYNICKEAKSRRGLKETIETRLKKSIAHTGLKQSPETTMKISFANTGQKRSMETREKMSKIAKARNLIGSRNPFYGKKHTTETIEKFKKVRNEFKYNDTRIPVEKIELRTGKILAYYESMRQAARMNNLSKSLIQTVIMENTKSNKKRTAGGFLWKKELGVRP